MFAVFCAPLHPTIPPTAHYTTHHPLYTAQHPKNANISNRFLSSSSFIGCGGSLTAAQGSIFSPGFPSNYSRASNCHWNININTTQRIQLTISPLDFPNNTQCRYFSHTRLLYYCVSFLVRFSILCYKTSTNNDGSKCCTV